MNRTESCIIICDGCNVREPFEHRCHGYSSVVYGEQTNKICGCRECREQDLRFPSSALVKISDNQFSR